MTVIHSHSMGRIWNRSTGGANSIIDARHLAWMTKAERCRAERLRQAKMLFEGRHRQYYIDESRSAYTFPPLRENEQAYFRPYNLLTLVAEKMADILFGESPRLYIYDDAAQQRIDAIAERSWLMALLLDAAGEACWAGETFIEVTRSGGEARLAHAPADQIWPQGMAGPDQQYDHYVRYATWCVRPENTEARPVTLLLETHYTPGLIERKLYQLHDADMKGPQRDKLLPLDQWPARINGQPLPESERTGLTRPNIIRIPNGFGGRSDYDGLIEPQDSLHAANTQIGRVLAKHADPKLAAPAAMADSQSGNMPAGAEVYFFRNKEELPQYITWNAELASAMEDRQFALTALATAAEMPLSLLGVKDDSSVETAAKMRLAAAPALAKGQRKAVIWQQGIRMAMALAYQAETGVMPSAPIGVEMRDGLPDDEMERANVIATLRGARVMSRRRAVQQQWLDAGSVRDELAELEREDAAGTPSVLFGEPGETE